MIFLLKQPYSASLSPNHTIKLFTHDKNMKEVATNNNLIGSKNIAQKMISNIL